MITETNFFVLVILLASPVSLAWANTDYSKFKHDNPKHARLPCLLCHQRETNAARPTLPGRSNHAPCTGCHAQQFADSGSPICTVCHTDVQAGTVKPFPALQSFNVKFEHAKHWSGTGCVTCHRPTRRGVAPSIPQGFNAHTTCFACHTPTAKSSDGRSLSSCSTCHELGRPVWPTSRSTAFRVGFSHRNHGPSQILNCASCHRLISSASPGGQITSPLALNHHAPARASSCMTCHNGKRAFGGDDFSVCTRCHKGSSWLFRNR
jgi:c(7)-type cytochrome triheme protein